MDTSVRWLDTSKVFEPFLPADRAFRSACSRLMVSKSAERDVSEAAASECKQSLPSDIMAAVPTREFTALRPDVKLQGG